MITPGKRARVMAVAEQRLAHLTRPDDESLRPVMARVGRELSLHLSEHWPAACASTDEGAIDVVDFFSGCGGMSAGFRALNAFVPAYKSVVAVDIDAIANESFQVNLGLEPASLDLLRISKNPKALDKLLSARRRHHPLVFIGCAPCQGFSSHRNEDGRTDPRNPLFIEFARAAARVKADAVIAENVPELLTKAHWSLVGEARKLLESAGYWVHVGIVNMAQFGLPQERFRAVFMAFRRPFVAPRGFLPRAQFRTVRDAIGHLPSIRPGQRCLVDSLHFTAGHRESTVRTIRAVPKDGGNRPASVGPACLRRAKERQGRSAYDDVYGRLHWDRPAITITAYARNPASGRFVHPEQDRGLSVREAALLQGFPVDYDVRGSLDQKFRQLGNAVPPVFSSYLAAHVFGELLSPPVPDRDFDPGVTEPVGSSFSRIIGALKVGALPVAG